jgi:hypothetical protein
LEWSLWKGIALNMREWGESRHAWAVSPLGSWKGLGAETDSFDDLIQYAIVAIDIEIYTRLTMSSMKKLMEVSNQP